MHSIQNIIKSNESIHSFYKKEIAETQTRSLNRVSKTRFSLINPETFLKLSNNVKTFQDLIKNRKPTSKDSDGIDDLLENENYQQELLYLITKITNQYFSIFSDTDQNLDALLQESESFEDNKVVLKEITETIGLINSKVQKEGVISKLTHNITKKGVFEDTELKDHFKNFASIQNLRLKLKAPFNYGFTNPNSDQYPKDMFEGICHGITQLYIASFVSILRESGDLPTRDLLIALTNDFKYGSSGASQLLQLSTLEYFSNSPLPTTDIIPRLYKEKPFRDVKAIKLDPNTIQINDEKNTEEIHILLRSLETGIYYLYGFKHSMVVIKNGEELFFFDSNQGLMDDEYAIARHLNKNIQNGEPIPFDDDFNQFIDESINVSQNTKFIKEMHSPLSELFQKRNFHLWGNIIEKSKKKLEELDAKLEDIEYAEKIYYYLTRYSSIAITRIEPVDEGDHPLLRKTKASFLDYLQNANVKGKESTLMHCVIEHGSVEELQSLLDHGFNPNNGNGSNETPLLVAARFNRIGHVKCLLDSGKLNLEDKTILSNLLFIAINKQYTDLIQLLLDHEGIDINFNSSDKTFLSIAIQTNNIELAKNLIERGSDLSIAKAYGGTYLMQAIQKGNFEMIKLFLDQNEIDINYKDKLDSTALFKALGKNDLELFQRLLEKNADISLTKNNGDSVASQAIKYSKIEFLKALCSSQDSNILKSFLGKDGLSLLALTVLEDHDKITHLLLDNGHLIHQAGDTGISALTLAILKDKTEIIEAMLNTNQEYELSEGCVTPLHAASFLNNVNLANQLLKMGYNPNHNDSAGVSPLDIAKRKQSKELIELFAITNDQGDLEESEQNENDFGDIDALKGKYIKGNNRNSTNQNNWNRSWFDASPDKEYNSITVEEEVRNQNIRQILNWIKEEKLNVDQVLDNGQTLLTSFTRSRNYDAVVALIQQGADINLPSDNHLNALFMAIQNNDSKMVDLLLKKGADYVLLGENQLNALEYSTKLDASLEIQKNLIESVNSKEILEKQIVSYIQSNNIELASACIDQEVDLKKVAEANAELINNSSDFLEGIFILAVKYDQPTLVEKCLNLGANPNSLIGGKCPLEMAKSITVIDMLLDEEANPTKKIDSIFESAMNAGHFQLAHNLLDLGAKHKMPGLEYALSKKLKSFKS